MKINGNTKISDSNVSLNDLLTRPPVSHASTTNEYGVGTPTVYGHTKVINDLTRSSYVDGEALSAYQGYVLDQRDKYSTTEKAIGVWIDGKTLYRRTYNSFTFQSDTNWDYIILDADTGKHIKDSYGTLMLGSFEVSIGSGDAGWGVISKVNKNSAGLIFVARTRGAYGVFAGGEITIEYTKN